jgi:class 3 adenylate cyclase/cell division septation protein DedD
MRSADKVDALLKARAEIDEQLRRQKNALTVLFTDVVGSTGFFERNGDTAGLVMLHRHDELAKRAIEQHDGKVIKMIGDSAMAEFDEPVSAVRAAVEIEQQFLKLNATLPDDQRIQVRIGIHTGVGFRKGNDVFGDVVNVASRIVKRTAPSQILISRAMHEAVSAEEDLHCRWLNRLTMDGRTEKEDIYEVIWTDPETYRGMQEKVASTSPIPARYEVLSQIGVGGTGIVYKVRDLETSEIVALKVLKPEIASNPDVQENFKRELCVARKITHKNVCRIYDFNRSNGTACTSMEFVEGESLSARLSRAGAMPVNEAIDIARQICAGLREAHAQGIVHRDLKPANVMIDRSGTVKIMDFGIARMVQRDGPMTGTIVGTPQYMAPEQAELKPLTTRTDIYALGLLLYEMITGAGAFSGDTPVAVALKQIREYPKRPREIVPQLSGPVDAAIMKCLQKDPAKRFASVDALEVALVRAAKAKRASAWEIALDRWLERTEAELRKNFQFAAERAEALLKRQDWTALACMYKEPPVAMLGVAGMAGALTIFLWFGSWKPRAMSAQTVQAAATAGAISPTASAQLGASKFTVLAPADSATSGPMQSREITLFEDVKIGGNQAAGAAANSQKTSELRNASIDTGAGASHSASAKPTRHENGSPREQSRKARKASAVTQNSASAAPATTTQADSVMVATATAPSSAEPAGSVRPISAAETAPESDSAALPLKADATPKKATSLYLEVGTFKDETWANNASDKLQQLGYHTILIHKNVLWMQSYHVQVGPYAGQEDLAAAQKSLAVQGFKTHPAN